MQTLGFNLLILIALISCLAGTAQAGSPCTDQELNQVKSPSLLQTYVSTKETFELKEQHCQRLKTSNQKSIVALITVLDAIGPKKMRNQIAIFSILEDRHGKLVTLAIRKDLGSELAPFRVNNSKPLYFASVDINHDGTDEVILNVGLAQSTAFYLFKFNANFNSIQNYKSFQDDDDEESDYFLTTPVKLPNLTVTSEGTQLETYSSSIEDDRMTKSTYRLQDNGYFKLLK